MLRVRRALLIVVGTALALAVLEIAARLLAPEEAPPPRFVESTPTYYVRDDILAEKDGPMLQHGLQAVAGSRLILPRKDDLRPNRDFLAERFDRFRAA